VFDISKIDFERLKKEFGRSASRHTTVQSLKQLIDDRLRRLMEQNPLRADFQKRYEEIVAEYNREKDRVTIEKTFEELMRFYGDMDEESRRASREDLDEETLAVFDLLNKPELTANERKKIKHIASSLLSKLKDSKLRIDHWQDKEAIRDAVKTVIRDYLWNDETGLPSDKYDEDEVSLKTDDVYRHMYRAYPTVPSPFYGGAA
jgi:type I restriction enzyme, R subunit